MNVIALLTPNMEYIIIAIAIIEVILFLKITHLCNDQQRTLRDTYRNITKGITDVPDSSSKQSFHDQCNALISFLERKLSSNSSDVTTIKRNISIQLEKNTISDTFKIESTFNICSAFVQIFPLLGILGTILSLSQVSISEGSIKASEVTSAFVIAIDTTILGMFFAVMFMMWEAKLTARVQRTINDSNSANSFFTTAII